MYFGKSGNTYQLESPHLHEGGEGFVYRVAKQQRFLAKIYKNAVSVDLERKLKVMFEFKNSVQDMWQNVSWVQDVLYDDKRRCVGYLMPEMLFDTDLLPNHKILGQAERYGITNRLKIKIAKNICEIISRVHQHKCAFGDFNPKNIGINSKTGDVYFIDTDTYQMLETGYEKCRCLVSFPGYVAPELLQRVSQYKRELLKKSKRHDITSGNPYYEMPLPTFTKETDLFALGIYIFQLLQNGYHPYSGVKIVPGRSAASPGVGDAPIEQDFYVFKQGISLRENAEIIPLNSFPPEIGQLFTRTFINGTKNPAARPSAKEWYDALERYESRLTQCRNNQLHQYYREKDELFRFFTSRDHCPYCKVTRTITRQNGNSAHIRQLPFSLQIFWAIFCFAITVAAVTIVGVVRIGLPQPHYPVPIAAPVARPAVPVVPDTPKAPIRNPAVPMPPSRRPVTRPPLRPTPRPVKPVAPTPPHPPDAPVNDKAQQIKNIVDGFLAMNPNENVRIPLESFRDVIMPQISADLALGKTTITVRNAGFLPGGNDETFVVEGFLNAPKSQQFDTVWKVACGRKAVLDTKNQTSQQKQIVAACRAFGNRIAAGTKRKINRPLRTQSRRNNRRNRRVNR